MSEVTAAEVEVWGLDLGNQLATFATTAEAFAFVRELVDEQCFTVDDLAVQSGGWVLTGQRLADELRVLA